MRRTRNDGFRQRGALVWHNPELGGPSGRPGERTTQTREERRALKAQRAALEALFSPKKEGEGDAARAGKAEPAASRQNGKIVLAPPAESDPRAVERQRLLAKLLSAASRPAISKATDELLRNGHSLPDDQEVHLQILEHTDEERVRQAIEALSRLLAGELPKRKSVLESRLRRIEEFAEEPATRHAAERLRRQVSGRAP